MKFEQIAIKNFRNFENIEICISNKNIFFGLNDIGKTNFLYALRYVFEDPPHNCAQPRHIIPADPKFREKAQFKRIVCTRNKPRYATFIRLRARYKFASANSVQQC